MASQESLYQPLDKESRSIRLLRILSEPHPSDGRLHCSLITVDLDKAVEYRALSYTWGEPDSFDFKIWVNEILVPVRQNLLCALRVLRANYVDVGDTKVAETPDFSPTTSEFYLWADALCINQDDDTERGHQVAMMGDIYRNAYEVFAWLGTPDWAERLNVALDLKVAPPDIMDVPAFEFVASAMDVYGSTAVEKNDSVQEVKEKICALVNFNVESVDGFEEFSDLCCFEYWSRLWIIQELCLARRVTLLYGRKTLNWVVLGALRREMARAFPSYDSSTVGVPQSLRPLRWWPMKRRVLDSRLWNILQLLDTDVTQPKSSLAESVVNENVGGFVGTHLLWVLEASQFSICHERRDKLHGILGLACDVGTGDIAVDYSIDLFEVYVNAMAFFTKGARESPFLTEYESGIYQVQCSQLLQDTLLKPNFEGPGQAEMRSGRLKCANGSLPTFVLHGFAESNIVNVWDKGTHAPISSEVPSKCGQICCRSRTDHSTAEPVANDRLLREAWEADKHVLHSLLDAEESCDQPGSLGLTFFRTDRERMGVGPTGISPGDMLWVYPTNSPPLAIIRKCDGMVKIVGRACFLRGLGEEWGVDQKRQTESSKDNITLKLNLAELQILTCPFVFEEAREIRLDFSTVDFQRTEGLGDLFSVRYRDYIWKKKKRQGIPFV